MKKIFVSIFFILVSMSIALAQTSTGRLSGTVSAADGALPGATVVATDNATGKSATVTTNDTGGFVFPQLDAGVYTLRITSQGFATLNVNDLKVDVGRDNSRDYVLTVGNAGAEVTVTGGADVVTNTTSQVSNTVSPQQILSLPLITRNPLTLTTLQAGTQSNPFQNTTINGVRTSFTNITRDGINIQDSFIRTNATDFAPGRPSVDDTAEFTIITSNQEADQGYGSAQIRLATPRGTKDFHGALFEYNRNSNFSANNFFSNRSGSARPFRNRNQFGGKIGGPLPVPGFGEGTPVLFKDKGFFFFNYEKIIDPLSTGATRTILTPSARAGAFQYVRATPGAAINTTVGTATVTCPATTVANTGVCTISDILGFARASNLPLTTGTTGVAIPATIDPIIQSRIISQLPTTSNATGGDSLNTAGYFINRKSNQERSTYTGRVDVDFDDRNTINGVYSYTFETNLRPDVDSTGFSQTPTGSQTAKGKTLSLAYRRVFTPNIVNELRGGVFFNDVPFQRDVPAPSLFLSVPLVSNPENNFLNQGRAPKLYTVQDNVDYIAGKHSFRFGGQYQLFKVPSYNFVGTVPTATITTNNGTTPLFATSNFANVGGIGTANLGTANGLLALLGGIVAQETQTFNLVDPNSGFQVAPRFSPFKYQNNAIYINDRYQFNRQLTVNGGVRYEVFPALKLANGLGLEPVIADLDNPVASLLNPNGTYNVLGTNSGGEFTYYKTDFNNFAPSIGFAYSPGFEKGLGKFVLGNSFVVRGGFSRAYGNDQLVTGIDSAITSNVGFAGRTGFGLSSTGSTLINSRLSSGIPVITPPTFAAPPFTYIRNNTSGISGTANFGTVFAVDPKLQTPSVDQYSLGFQREFFGNMALEVRYVGTRSTNLVRGVDLNQFNINANGFLADFNRASSNYALTQNAFCTTAQNAGCQALTVFQNGGTPGAGRLVIGTGGLATNTFISNLQNGTPADLAFTIINLGFNNTPTANAPTAVPYVSFLANPSTGAVDYLLNDAKFFYNSAQVELRRRFANGLYFQANYTFSKNLTNAVGSLNGPNSGQSLFEPYLDNANQSLDYTRADYDQTHAFNFNGVYQLPFGKGKAFLNQGGIVDKVFGGFELSGILQTGSGAPITFVDSNGTLNRTARSGRQTPFSTLSPSQIQDLVGIFKQKDASGVERIYYINPSIIDPATGRASNGYIYRGTGTLNANTAFAGQVFFNNAPGTTGNISRFLINGPKTFNVNAALLKNISFTESTRFQIRVEAFNLFNNVVFFNNTQLANINSTTFGQITSAGAARTIQFAGRFEF